MVANELLRQEGENEEQYIWRLGQLKDTGLADLEWDDIADLVNKEFREEDCQYKESAYRKPYQNAKRFFEAGVFCTALTEETCDDISIRLQELRKEKQRVSDERVELSRLLREQARRESFVSMVKNIMASALPLSLNYDPHDSLISNNDLIVTLTDIHSGIEINNHFNTYNKEVLVSRLHFYLSKILEIRKTHNSENCYVIIGEIISGFIHETLRIENNENVVEQFKTISTLISEFLAILSSHFNSVNVYVAPGNHSRLSPKKEESLKGENMDIFLPFYLRAKLQNFKNIHVFDNEVDSDIAIFTLRGLTIMAAHGDKDSPDTVVQKFTMLFGKKPDLIYLGHRHKNGLSTVYDTKIIESGCISGSDSYALDKRFRNKPEQTVSVVDTTGLVAVYDVKLDIK